MPLVPAHEILADARRRQYGIPCLLAADLTMLVGQLRAAEAVRAPLILAFNEAVTPEIPIDLAMPAMVEAAQRAPVPVATILDHGNTYERALKAMELGSSSVMFDGSAMPYEENVRCTAEVVSAGHAQGVSVEGELGAVGGSSIELGRGDDYCSSMTDPELVVDFVQRTGVDVLAISFGNSHGIYKGPPQLNLDLVRSVAAKLDVPLAMHGASGLTEDRYGPILESGISKINYYTAMAREVSKQLRDWTAQAGEDQLVYHHLLTATIDSFDTETRRLLTVLRAIGTTDSS